MRWLCKLLGHKLTLDFKRDSHLIDRVWRLRCTRCGACDPYQHG